MENLIVALVIAFIIALAIIKIVGEKRKGVRCVGCAQGGTCSSKKSPKH